MVDGDHVGDKEEKALEDDYPVMIVLGQQSALCLSSRVKNNRVRLRKDEGRLLSRRFDEERNLSQRVQGKMLGPMMRKACKVHKLRKR